jgi:hypothetical protein
LTLFVVNFNVNFCSCELILHAQSLPRLDCTGTNFRQIACDFPGIYNANSYVYNYISQTLVKEKCVQAPAFYSADNVLFNITYYSGMKLKGGRARNFLEIFTLVNFTKFVHFTCQFQWLAWNRNKPECFGEFRLRPRDACGPIACVFVLNSIRRIAAIFLVRVKRF